MPLDVCDKCGATDEGIAWFAPAYRKAVIKRGRADPGNLCDKCARAFVYRFEPQSRSLREEIGPMVVLK